MNIKTLNSIYVLILTFFILAVPVRAEEPVLLQKIQPGNDLFIKVFQEQDLTGKYHVSEEGKINFPMVGDLVARDLTLQDFRGVLREKLKRFIRDPQISIDLVEGSEAIVKTKDAIMVLGQVRRQGTLEAGPGGLTLIQVIAESGGLDALANASRIKVVTSKDGKKSTRHYNLHAILDGKQEDPVLLPGDVVFVPESIF